MPDLLLDTCAVIWLATDQPVAAGALEAMDRAYHEDDTIWVSPISAWEIGLLAARGRLSLPTPPAAWFRKLLAQPGVQLCDLAPEVLIDSSFLPGTPPRDPADRIVLATARARALPVVTRDRALLAYAAAGHVTVIPC